VHGEDDCGDHGLCGRINDRLRSRTVCVISASGSTPARRCEASESMAQPMCVAEHDEVVARQRERVVEVH
jgi:hypothetical protein